MLADVVEAAASVIALPLVVFAYERALFPLYASAPTQHFLIYFVGAALAAASFWPYRISTTFKGLPAAAVYALAPNASFLVAVYSARWKSPIWGPVFTHATVLFPMLLSSGVFQSAGKSLLVKVLINATSFTLIWYGKDALYRVEYLNSVSENEVFLDLSFLYIAAAILRLPSILPPRPTVPKPEPKKGKKNKTEEKPAPEVSGEPSAMQSKSTILLVFIALAATIYPKLANSVLPHPLTEIYTHPSYPLQILQSTQSTTGLIVVGQSLDPLPNAEPRDRQMSNVRYLRAAHSLLGGVWMGPKIWRTTPTNDSLGTPLGDSIYCAFTLQEAARLVNSNPPAENALIIGLGVGISASAFMRHGLDTTIVEIDPAVYAASRDWFGLPDPGADRVFLEDARMWAAKRREMVESGESKRYDIAVHDCFSGGSIPEHVFTVEMWEDMKAILSSDGVLVVNFAGHVNSDPMRLVAHTLTTVFGQCRAFHDYYNTNDPVLLKGILEHDFINVVFFCTASDVPMTFRPANFDDFLGSALRQRVLSELREVDLKQVISNIPADKLDEFVVTDKNNPLGKLQLAQGDTHWTVMRDVLTDTFWETY
ncbi:hypothetical protein CYLTODRAFT_420421 [Cylindrobasidium torrendii FP15055 ss-10]|uniref:S-adenosyl-L-methionine-dependent methyltransferase n=1 Tax=Cylindrobasidium torrendii FP15055 ss-10 TaxID=1314674 RepID=A0A0D7BGY4_9AGAR|nr:hypothetical protein CYLTODRAFT_420421 [Cylindrobasidium torrendii FP15055 ss-10]